MGIRVNKETLTQQLKDSNQMDKANQTYHQMILNNELPYTIGGGIGQSRICMILLEKYHIAEVQASIWDSNSKKFFKEHKLNIL
jgi:aspartate--ammonia ligase